MSIIINKLPWRNPHRYTTTWKIANTVFFRLASTKILGNSELCSFGGNFQNKDKSLRYCWTADEGKKLGQIDESGADAMIVAYECSPTSNFRKLFNNGIKPHSYCALNIFLDRWLKDVGSAKEILNMPIDDITKHPDYNKLFKMIKNSDDEPMRYYYLGKKTIHGSNYDMKCKTYVTAILEETDGLVNIPERMGTLFLEKHHDKFPEIRKEFQMGIINEASANGCIIRNNFGHPIQFSQFEWGDKLYREMYSAKPQCTVAVIIHNAITSIQNDIEENNIPKEWGLDILQNNHDSLLWQNWDDPVIEKEVAQYMKPKVTGQALMSKFGETFYMKAEIGVGKNWSPYHETKNPFGLKEVNY